MKECEMRWKPNSTDSVIGSLMAFDKLRPQPPFHEKRRVLSESYVRKADSIELRPGSLIPITRSHSTNTEIVDGVSNKCVNSSTRNVRNGVSPKSAGASITKSLSGGSYEDRKSVEKIGEHFATRHVLRYQQKLEHDSLGIGSMKNSLTFQLEMTDKLRLFSTSISPLKANLEKVAYGFEDVKFGVRSRPGCREQRKSSRPENGKLHHESPHSCIPCTEIMNRVYPQESHRSKLEEVIKSGYTGDNYIVNGIHKNHIDDQHHFLNRSSLANKSRRQNFGRWKTAKEVQEFGVSGRNETLCEMLRLTDKNLMSINSDSRLGRNGVCSSSRSPDSSSPSAFSSTDVWDDDCLKSSPDVEFSNDWNLKQDESTAVDKKPEEQRTYQKDILESLSGWATEFQTPLDADDTVSQISDLAAQYMNDAAYASSEAPSVRVSPGIIGDPQSESNSVILSGEGGSSYVEEVFDRKASFNEFPEEESAYSNCSGICPPSSLENLNRTNQHSPDLVRGPFDIKTSSSFECLDSIGQQLQLEALNFESEETYSEGSVMVVSEDDDSVEQFDDLSRDGRKVKRWLGDDESMNFSYLVDVLDEAGLFGTNSFMNLKTWYSLECPISPLVFDALEKKYGKQTSWQKSERRLLFDRINAGLMAIFDPVMNFHSATTSMRRRLCSSFRRDEVEDELWMMLVGQENEKSNELSEKALDKWLELEEGANIICGELETSLFDELVMELACL